MENFTAENRAMSALTYLFPGLAEASDHATIVDLMTLWFSIAVLVFTLPVFGFLLYFSVKYRHGSTADRANPPEGSIRLEIAWMIIPLLPILGFFAWSAWDFMEISRPPAGALEIYVVAKQWMWKFQHPSGEREINDLHVPVDTPIKLTMISQDVIHSLFLPELRIKQDVLPGRYTTLWFKANETGTFALRCTQFCGTNHAVMGGHLIVMPQSEYAQWLKAASTDMTLVAEGETLFRKVGCSGCHDPSATIHAPSLQDLYGSPVPLSDGRVVIADDAYIRDSILFPDRDIAAGYPPSMPSFQNVLDEDDLVRLIEYIKFRHAKAEVRP
jgi:cytochrome c oxidase subunit 2